jgi:predicted alpha/beta hydrolase family esterase
MSIGSIRQTALRRRAAKEHFMTIQVLFVHGAGEGAHACDAKLATSLREKLGAGYVVHYPLLPNEADPVYEAWQRCIAEELAMLGNGVVLVGHSIGASVLIAALAAGALGQSVAGVFLLAAPFWHDHEVWRWQEAELPVDAADLLPAGVPVFLYHGREDEVVPFSHLALYARTFPQATVRALAARNHQLNDDLTEVADDIRTCLGQRR